MSVEEPSERPVEPAPEQPPDAGKPRLSHRERAKIGVAGLFGWLGIFGVGAAIGAILGWQDVRGWLIGVIVSAVTVVLGFLLRRSLPTL